MLDAIVVPRGAEASAVRRALASSGATVALTEMGIGPRAGTLAAEALLAAETPPKRVLIAGLAGVLSPALAVGDVLLYSSLLRDGAPGLALDRAFAAEVAGALPGALGGIVGIESTTIVTRASEKRALAARTNASAVDMESYAVVEGLRARGIATAVVRVASDALDDDLPQIDRALDASGGIDGFAMFLAMLREPANGVAMARNGLRALGVLRAAIRTLVR